MMTEEQQRIMMSQLLDKGKLTSIDEFDSGQLSRLTTPMVFQLIYANKLTVQDALDLKSDQLARLTTPMVFQLIYDNKLTVREALELKQNQEERLTTPTVFQSIMKGLLTVRDAISNIFSSPKSVISPNPDYFSLFATRKRIDEARRNGNAFAQAEHDRQFGLVVHSTANKR